MSRISHVNDACLPHNHTAFSIEDRGFLSADDVYEIIALINGRNADERDHFDSWSAPWVSLNCSSQIEPTHAVITNIK
jgi:branched-subunit amino acid aminotransferase/4-amino-4-deoxychorismate lyase